MDVVSRDELLDGVHAIVRRALRSRSASATVHARIRAAFDQMKSHYRPESVTDETIAALLAYRITAHLLDQAE